MKVTKKILSVPPYLSTTWDNIKSIQTKGTSVFVTLTSNMNVEIPNLRSEEIESIFASYTSFLEEQPSAKSSISFSSMQMTPEQIMDLPLRLGIGSMENMGSLLQHNPAQMNAPDLPKPILQKISAIAKIMSPEDIEGMPKPEPHCNCIHCQLLRAITQGVQPSEEEKEEGEPVSEEDLTFSQWDIAQTGDQLFTVTNRLDSNEKYTVYLGDPVGCTCGKPGCEHIVAVLKS